MKHLFIPYKLAVIAKEKGFDEESIAYYYPYFHKKIYEITVKAQEKYHNNHALILAPLYQQIIDWFRENHQIWISVDWAGRPQIFDLKPRENSYKGKSLFDICINDRYGGFEYYFALDKAIEQAFKLI